MSNANKKRGGIGGFWDTLAPEQLAPPADDTSRTDDQTPAQQRQPSTRRRQQTPPVAPLPVTLPEPKRGPGRPRNEEPKARTTVNMSPRSWRLLEALRYRARMQGRRNTTYADLLDEAITLLADQRNVTLEDE
jgi:hypothetical protein